jgi:hypothetical protein
MVELVQLGRKYDELGAEFGCSSWSMRQWVKRADRYVVDHKQALKHGGADNPSNMQWQTRAAATAKDKVE